MAEPRARLFIRSFKPFSVALMLLASACTAYTVGNTAQTVPRGERTKSVSVYYIPETRWLRDSASPPLPGIDGEWRFGLTDNSDMGVRVVSMTGILISYRKRIAGPNDPDSAAIAWMIGAGPVRAFYAAEVDATLIMSGNRRHIFQPYGGLRTMYSVPYKQGIGKNTFSAGAFFGVNIGDWLDAFVPEFAIYYEEPDFTSGRSNILFVPSITIRGDWLFKPDGPIRFPPRSSRK